MNRLERFCTAEWLAKPFERAVNRQERRVNKVKPYPLTERSVNVGQGFKLVVKRTRDSMKKRGMIWVTLREVTAEMTLMAKFKGELEK